MYMATLPICFLRKSDIERIHLATLEQTHFSVKQNAGQSSKRD